MYVTSLTLNIKPSIKTVIIGPIEQSATKPKLSFSESLLSLIDAAPIPSAIMNGTVIGPVVTPPESKAIAQKSFGTKLASTKVIR